jgi:hypothetical protein
MRYYIGILADRQRLVFGFFVFSGMREAIVHVLGLSGLTKQPRWATIHLFPFGGL